MESSYLKNKKLPDKSGIYFFHKGKNILYIGKATSLLDRTKSYFSKDLIDARGPLIVDMIFKADKISFQITDSVLEALILEATLIKKYQPYYNTREKDDRSFNYVCITKPARNTTHSVTGGDFLPRVLIVRGRNVKHRVFDKIYGPYTSGTQLREAMKIIRRIFPFLDEKSKNYMEFYKQINLVPDLNDHKLYLENIRNIKLFFEGKKKKVLINLQKEMKKYAKAHAFEKAGEIKRQIFALQHINDVALLKNEGQYALERTLGRSDDDGQRKFSGENFRGESESILPEVLRIEAYDIAHMGGKNMVGVMTVIENGEVNKSEYKKFKIKTQTRSNDTGALAEIIERRLAHREWSYPDLIVVDGGVAQLNVGMYVLKKFGLKIPVVSVLKNERHKPKDILGDKEYAIKYKREILLANNEAHRFAIAYHKKIRSKNFLP